MLSSESSEVPPIAVLLAVHNGMPYLVEACDSLRRQTFEHFQVLVLDDGSTDDSACYAESIDDKRFTLIRLDQAGLASALNHGIDKCRSPYIARMDADDVALPNRLGEQFAYMLQDQNRVLAGCDFERIDTAGGVIGHWHCLRSDAALRFQMLFTCPFLHPGTIFRRDAVLKAGKYSTTFIVAQDYELWSRVAFQGSIGNVPAVLMKYRSNPQGVSAKDPVNQVTNASRAASNFAAGLDIGISAEQWFQVHRLVTAGAYDESTRPGSIVDTFVEVEAYFREWCQDCKDEYERVRKEFRSKLQWRLADAIEDQVRRGDTRWEWIHAYLRLRVTDSWFGRRRSRPKNNAGDYLPL